MSMYNFTKGFIRENPIFTLLLGLCPALAVSNMAINGLGMGVATLFVLVGSNVVVSLLKNFIPEKIRIPSYILIIASFVTIVKLVMNAYVIELFISLGIFIPLIVVNCMILGRAEAFASKNTVWTSFVDGLGMGIAFTVSMTILSILREVPGSGTITLMLDYGGTKIGYFKDLKPWMEAIGLSVNGKAAPLIVFILPAGGFIAIGLFLGLFNRIKDNLSPLTEEEEEL